MATIAVIDGLSRSGTTLLASMIHSQQQAAVLRGAFHELLAFDNRGWAVRHAKMPIFTLGNVAFSDDRFFDRISSDVLGLRKLSVRRLFELTTKRLDAREQYGEISRSDFFKLIEDRQIGSFAALDLLYDDLASKLNVQVLGLRWNQALSWFPVWQRRESHKWIAVIRDPVARAISARKSHGWDEGESLLAAQCYAEKLGILSTDKNLKLVFFEELIRDPAGQLQEIMGFLGFVPDYLTLDLVGQDGAPYRVESSDLIDEGHSHLSGKKFEGFSGDSLNKYRGSSLYRKYSYLSRYPVYTRYF
ncbi:sulfotransferase domain-containing protein [Luminiphilus sp.]|nr:sulfotransferase domain-containing protein [Luminiphilus sp.]